MQPLTDQLLYTITISLNMHSINKGNLFSTTDCRLEINPVSLNTQPHIILNGLKCRNPRNKQFPHLTTASTDDPSSDPPLYTLNHDFNEYAISNGNLVSAKVETAIPSGLCIKYIIRNVAKLKLIKCCNSPLQLIY
jgi:hypothetical protein